MRATAFGLVATLAAAVPGPVLRAPRSSSPARAQGATIRLLSLKLGQVQGSEVRMDGSEARVNWPANRLVFTQHDVHLWVEAMPGHGWRDSYVIDGLSNPELQLVRGARLTVTLLNLDPDFSATFIFDNRGPPFTDWFPVPPVWMTRRIEPKHGLLSHIVFGHGLARDGDTYFDAQLDYAVDGAGVSWYRAINASIANLGQDGKIRIVP